MVYVKKADREKINMYSNFHWMCNQEMLIDFLEKCYIKNHFFVKVAKNKYQCTDGYIVECEEKKIGDFLYHDQNKMKYEIKRANANPIKNLACNSTVNFIDTIYGELVQWSFIYQRTYDKENKRYKFEVAKHPYYLSEIENGANNFKLSYGMLASQSGFYYHAKKEWRVPTAKCTFNQRGFTLMGKDAIELYPYTGFDSIECEQSDLYDFEDYLKHWKRHPETEQIIKLGFYGMVKDIAYTKSVFNFKGKSFKQITGLDKTFQEIVKHTEFDKQIYKLVLTYDFSPNEAIVLIKAQENNWYRVYGNSIHNLSQNPHFETYIPKKKQKQVLLYVAENNKIEMRDYTDTLKWLVELDYPYRNEYAMPKDFKKLHDTLMKEYAKHRETCFNQKIAQVAEQLKRFTYQNKTYYIEPFMTQKELISESEALNHCIRTYAEKYSKHETELYKIRLLDQIGKPYYSLEIIDGKVIQCRGENNQIAPKEIITFYETWLKNIRNKGEMNDRTN